MQRKSGAGEGARKGEGASLPSASARGSEGQAPVETERRAGVWKVEAEVTPLGVTRGRGKGRHRGGWLESEKA